MRTDGHYGYFFPGSGAVPGIQAPPVQRRIGGNHHIEDRIAEVVAERIADDVFKSQLRGKEDVLLAIAGAMDKKNYQCMPTSLADIRPAVA